jgi:hypothetical protein
MPPLDHILAAIVLALAAAAAWGDLRPMIPYVLGRTGYAGASHGRIPNALQLAWLLFGLAALGLAWAYPALGGTYHAPGWVEASEGIPFALAVCANALLALTLGIILWLLGLWAAGDAKTFALIAFTLPLSAYSRSYMPWFPSFALFFNTFVAMFCILLVEFAIRTTLAVGRTPAASWKGRVASLAARGFENRWGIARLVLLFLGIFTTIRILRHFAREGLEGFLEVNKTVVYVILFLMFRPLMRFAQKPLAIVAAAMVVGGYAVYAFFFDATGQAKYEFINIGWLAASIIVFRWVYDAYLKATDAVPIPWSQLRRGMLLSDPEILRFKERKQFFSEQIGALSPDGLTEEQALAVRGWFEQNAPTEPVWVCRTIPFVPALFVGTLLTLLARGLAVVL